MNTNTLPKKDPKLRENRRFQAVKMARRNLSQSEIAERLGVTRQAVHAWLKRYQRNGSSSLRSTKSEGRPSKIDFEIVQSRLPKIIGKGALAYGYTNNTWSTASVREVLLNELKVDYHRDHVRKILHKIGFTCQKPERRAVERNERHIRHWVNNVWPDIKKKP